MKLRLRRSNFARLDLLSTGAGKEGSFSNAAVSRTRQRVRELTDKLEAIKDALCVTMDRSNNGESSVHPKWTMKAESDSLAELETDTGQKMLRSYETTAGTIGESQLRLAGIERDIEALERDD